MVKSIIQIAPSPGRQTIAECMQDAGTIEWLREFGVNYAQGNFIGKAAECPQKEVFLQQVPTRRPVMARA